MNLIQMKCPNCNANLEVEDGIDSFFCRYCGTKIMVQGQSNAAYTAKTVNNIANRLLDQREIRMAQRAEERRKEAEHARKMRPYILIGCVVMFIVIIAFCLFMARSDSSSPSGPAPTQQVAQAVSNSDSTSDSIKGLQDEAQNAVNTINEFRDIFGQLGTGGSKTPSASSGQNAVQAINNAASSQKLVEVVAPAIATGDYGIKTINGQLKNVSGNTLSYVQITFALYDKDGAQIGTAVANINNLTADSIWKYSATPLTMDEWTRFEQTEIDSF